MLASSRWLRPCALAFTALLIPATLLATAGTAEAAESARERKIERAVEVARNQIGDPYRYGAAGPGAFDCSGLMMFAYNKAGISLPRTTGTQASHVRRIYKNNMHKGDLMFFYGSGGVYHVGMFVGWDSGRRVILHASSSSRPVQKDPVWTNNWYAGTLRPRK